MKTSCKTSLALLLGLGAMATASAGTLEFQGVRFQSSWKENILTLRIDAARRNGDWGRAASIGALQLKGVGSFDKVSLSAAPGGAANWTQSNRELGAGGCGGVVQVGSNLCFSGPPVPLGDGMVFRFAFAGGTTEFSSPHVTVNFMGAGGGQVGSLLSRNIPLAAVPEPRVYAMALAGLGLLGALARRRRRASAK